MSKAVSLSIAAATLGLSRNTLSGWIAKGCPVVSNADRTQGVEWKLDIAAIHKWRVEFAVKEAVAGYQTEGGGVSKDEADRRRAVAMAIVAEIEADVAQKSVVAVEDVGRIVEQEYSIVRSAILGMPSKLADRCVGKDRAGIKIVLDQGADEVLSHLSESADMAKKAA